MARPNSSPKASISPQKKNSSSPREADFDIQQAGGLTTVADLDNVTIKRQFQGETLTLTLNLWDLAKKGQLKQDVTLRDGDEIIIPTQEIIDIGETRLLSDANFNGTDTFTYQANDGVLNSNIATVTITVDPEEDAPVPEFLTKSAIAKHRSLTGSGFEQSDRRFPQPTVCCQILS